MNTNGAIPASMIIAPNNYDFTELQARQIIAQVKKVVGSQGGQMPVTDVVGVLLIGVLLEKLSELSDRVAVIENAASVVVDRQAARP